MCSLNFLQHQLPAPDDKHTNDELGFEDRHCLYVATWKCNDAIQLAGSFFFHFPYSMFILQLI